MDGFSLKFRDLNLTDDAKASVHAPAMLDGSGFTVATGGASASGARIGRGQGAGDSAPLYLVGLALFVLVAIKLKKG